MKSQITFTDAYTRYDLGNAVVKSMGIKVDGGNNYFFLLKCNDKSKLGDYVVILHMNSKNDRHEGGVSFDAAPGPLPDNESDLQLSKTQTVNQIIHVIDQNDLDLFQSADVNVAGGDHWATVIGTIIGDGELVKDQTKSSTYNKVLQRVDELRHQTYEAKLERIQKSGKGPSDQPKPDPEPIRFRKFTKHPAGLFVLSGATHECTCPKCKSGGEKLHYEIEA